MSRLRVGEIVARIRKDLEKLERQTSARRSLLEHRGGLRGFPTLRGDEDLGRLNRGWAIDPRAEIRSHRRVIGPAIVAAKTRFQRWLVTAVLEGYLVREREFLSNLVRFLNRLVETIDLLASTGHADDELLVGRTEMLLQRMQEEERGLEYEVERLRQEVSALRRAVGEPSFRVPAHAPEPAGDGLRPWVTASDAERFAAYVAVLVENAPVLHVPAGRGDLLVLLREAAVAASGIEPDRERAAIARERGVDVREASLSLADASGLGSVAVTDTERLARDTLGRLLVEAVSAVRSGGLVLVEAPNPASYMGLVRLASCGAVGEGLAAEDLARVCEQAGLEDVEVDVTAIAPPPLSSPSATAHSPTLGAYAENFRLLNQILFAPAYQFAVGRRP